MPRARLAGMAGRRPHRQVAARCQGRIAGMLARRPRRGPEAGMLEARLRRLQAVILEARLRCPAEGGTLERRLRCLAEGGILAGHRLHPVRATLAGRRLHQVRAILAGRRLHPVQATLVGRLRRLAAGFQTRLRATLGVHLRRRVRMRMMKGRVGIVDGSRRDIQVGRRRVDCRKRLWIGLGILRLLDRRVRF